MESEIKLITKEIEATFPPLSYQENVPDPVAVIKIFDPLGRCTVYILEGSRHSDGDLLLFGFCPPPDDLGYASLRELESVRRPLGAGLRHNHSFKPTPLSTISAFEPYRPA